MYIQDITSRSHGIIGADTSIAAFVGMALHGPVNEPTIIHGFYDFEKLFGGHREGSMMSYAVDGFFLNGGEKAIVVRLKDSNASNLEYDSFQQAFHALEKVPSFNLMCIPPASRIQEIQPKIFQKALDLCNKKGAILIVDAPLSWGKSGIDTITVVKKGLIDLGISGEQARNAAMYFPSLSIPDPLKNNDPQLFAPCGAVAGIIAKTDRDHGVWKAPAGVNASLHGIQQLQIDLNDEQNQQLNLMGVNCLRSFPSNGHVIWGAKTMWGASRIKDDYTYLPVRRTALFIEDSIKKGTEWVIFEPNDETLWSKIRHNVGVFMYDLFRAGAFAGSRPEEAYFVKCGRDTMNQNDIREGLLNIIVGFAPLKPAEFIILKIQHPTGHVES